MAESVEAEHPATNAGYAVGRRNCTRERERGGTKEKRIENQEMDIVFLFPSSLFVPWQNS